ncbi:peptidoglycan-binding domain-containing protein [Microbacterium stercoris]|uniref:Peptidoglycan-binding protein n=1 Tax=Microbacterium stercoris TaxID=2820289 RepID=A0A939QHS3_9MICO|nr:hypothetical protein [Microbacterium stercoris]MBO3663078.1 hypothetical protein [Microbacterium stercoris]
MPDLAVASDSPADDYPIDSSQLTDARTVALSVQIGVPAVLQSPTEGVATRVACLPGEKMVSGSSSFSVDGRPLLNLQSEVPIWRDLHLGDSGPDVEALQDTLHSLGLAAGSGGVVSWQTLEGVNSLYKAIGASATDAIYRADILWLPVDQFLPVSCDVALGQQINLQASLATARGEVDSAMLTDPPSAMIDGARVVDIQGEKHPISAEGSLDEAGRVALQSSDAFAIARSQAQPSGVLKESTTLQVDVLFELAEPVDAWGVPVSALTDLADTSACVWAGATGYPVELVTSQLGKAYVAFPEDTDAPDAVSLSPAESSQGCR